MVVEIYCQPCVRAFPFSRGGSSVDLPHIFRSAGKRRLPIFRKIPEAELENLDAKSDYKISEDLEFRMRLDIRKVEQAPILNLKENKFY